MRGGWLVLACLTLFPACDREHRSFRSTPPGAVPTTVARLSELRPGAPTVETTVRSPYDGNAYGVAEGKRLFHLWNCVGCHANGGGAIGPALMDAQWRYGSEPENIYASIVQGRPNGMPSFDMIPSAQVWQLVSYVRSLSGMLNADVRTGRSDHMNVRVQEQALRGLVPKDTRTPRKPGGP